MKITALQEYGIRCMVQLASEEGGSLPRTTSSIAEKEGLSRDYVEKILFQLSKVKMVESVRGMNGGYILRKNADKISVGEIVMALSEKPVRMKQVKKDLCPQFPGKKNRCVHISGCAVRLLWTMVVTQVYGVLNHLPLSALVGSEEEIQKRLSALLIKRRSGEEVLA